eukprot:TRINITY_DN15757_c0_g1_i1.p1 TRINITY_DN15757_c0_g1~~TRINITY_DN15757_c0_g1_i1.p1  ORF type:complete len:379 (-),score=24.29 TRINITY_DN15757_c0_g1_i1:43-1179(-)
MLMIERLDCIFTGISMLMTLWFCRHAFLNERKYYPRQCVLNYKWILPHNVAYYLWLICCSLCLILVSLHSIFNHKILFLFIGIMVSIMLFFDRHIVAPHPVHFIIACFSFTLDKMIYLQLFSFCLYFFGGINKFNWRFAENFVQDFFGGFSESIFGINTNSILPREYWKATAYLAALSESLFGIFLLFDSTKMIGYLFISIMHVMILLFFGPIGKFKYEGIYGWNFFCIYQMIRFHLTEENSPLHFQIFSSIFTDFFLVLIIFLYGVLPFVNYYNDFGEKFSLKMHSYNFKKFKILLPRGLKYPTEIFKYLSSENESHYKFGLTQMMINESAMTPLLSKRSIIDLGKNISDILSLERILVYSNFYENGNKKRTLIFAN